MNPPLHLPPDVRLMNWVSSALFAALLVMALGGAVVWLVRHAGGMVGVMVVDGDVQHQNASAFRNYLVPHLSGSYLTLDLQEVRQAVESMPWVRRAVVRREFPDRLRITIEEHQAVAWWGGMDEGKLVNRQGEVFEANPDDPMADQWSVLEGSRVEDSHRVYSQYQAIKPVFQRAGLEVRKLEVNQRGSWRAELDNGAGMELGRGESSEMLNRVRVFAATVSQLTQRFGRDLEAVDLRYANGYAVRLRGVTTHVEDKAAVTGIKR